MRPLIAIILSTSIIGGIYAYMNFTDRIRPQRVRVEEAAARGRFDLEITLTFEAQGDDFGHPSLLVRYRDDEIMRVADRISAGTPIRLEGISGLVEGANDFFVQVVPASRTDTPRPVDDPFSLSPREAQDSTGDATPAGQAPVAAAIRLRVYRDENVIADQTFWSDPSWLVSGIVRVKVPRSTFDPSHDH